MLPVSPKTWLNNPLLTEFESGNYCIVRLCVLDWTYSSGLDKVKTLLMNAMKGAASYDLIKDWTAAEQTAVQTYLTTLLKLCQEYVSHRNIRVVAAQYCAKLGDDLKHIWTDATWLVFQNLMDKLTLPLLPEAIALTELLNPVVKYADGILERNINPGFLLYWVPSTTPSEAMALRADLLNALEGMNWIKKAQLRMDVGSIARALSAGPRFVTPGVSNEWMYWWAETPYYYDTSGTDTLDYGPGAPHVSSATNIESTVYYWLPRTEPVPMYGLKRLLFPYHATYNDVGRMVNPATANKIPGVTFANDKLHLAQIKFTGNDTSVTLPGKTDTVKFSGLLGVAIHDIADATHGTIDVRYSALATFFQSQTTGTTAWSYAAQNTLTTLWGVVHGPKPKGSRGPSSNAGNGRGRSEEMGDHRGGTSRRRRKGRQEPENN